MNYRNLFLAWVAALLSNGSLFVIAADTAPKIPAGIPVEALPPANSQSAKIVIVAGSSYYKPGEHEYIGGCSVLFDLLKQSPGVYPVLAVDWPKKPETFAGAKAVVFLFDGGEKHAILQGDRMLEMQKLASAGVGFVHLHQAFDYPQALGDRAREFMGAAWEKGYSQRADWIQEFKTFPDHPICRGVTPFKIDDGWLFNLRFVPDMKGITSLLKTVSPKEPAKAELGNDAIVAWTYERAGGGRSFTFTGCHLHASFAEEGYRRFLVNGILWGAGLEVPSTGAPVNLASSELGKYLSSK